MVSLVLVYDLRKDIIESLEEGAERVNEVYSLIARAVSEFQGEFSPADLLAACLKVLIRMSEAMIDRCISDGEMGSREDCVEIAYDFISTYAYLMTELASAYFRKKYGGVLERRYSSVIERIFNR